MRRYFQDSVIEVASRTTQRGLTPEMREADFCLDLVTFKVLKHRYGDYDCVPQQAYSWLTEYLEIGYIRILLLVD